MKPFAVLLIAFGLVALIYQGFTYTRRETVVDLGPLHAEADRQHTVPLPPIIGIIAVVAGAGLLATGARKA